MNYKLDKVSHVSKVCKENIGTQNLANSNGPLMASRTKHIEIKYNWFRLMIGDKIEIFRIDTKEERAETFTKCLTRFNFEHVCKRVMGW